MEKAITQGATMARKPMQEMTDAELSRIIGADVRDLSDDDLWKIIERDEP